MNSSQSSIGVPSPPVNSTLVEELEEELDCPICLEKMEAPDGRLPNYRYIGSTSCGHKYHFDCWHGWYSLRPEDTRMCPCCNECIPRCCLCNQHVSSFDTIAPPPLVNVSPSSSSSSSTSSSPDNQVHDVQVPSMEQDVDDEDDDNNIEMPVETLVRETLWSNDFEVVEEAMQELYERILGDDESLKYLVALGTHAIVIRAMERFEAELAEPSGIYLSSGVLCFMFILFRVHKDEDLYVDPVLAASGLLSMVKVVQAHSNNLQIVKTGMDAMFNIFGASEAILDDGPNAIYLVQPMIKQGVIQLTVEFMKKFLELVDESSEGPLTVALMNLHIFLFYGGPRTIDILAQEIGVVKDDDDNDKTCSGFGVVLEMMNALPDVKMIQYYGCVVLTLNPQTGVYRERLRQLGAIDAISSAASFPDEEVREVATDALAAFKDSEHV